MPNCWPWLRIQAQNQCHVAWAYYELLQRLSVKFSAKDQKICADMSRKRNPVACRHYYMFEFGLGFDLANINGKPTLTAFLKTDFVIRLFQNQSFIQQTCYWLLNVGYINKRQANRCLEPVPCSKLKTSPSGDPKILCGSRSASWRSVIRSVLAYIAFI